MPNAPDNRDSFRRTVKRYGSDANAAPPESLDAEAYQLLQNRRRRYLLYCLVDNEGEVSLSSAVDAVTAWECDCSVEDVRQTDRRCVYSTVRQNHVPRLEAEDVVVYDPDDGTISLGPGAEKATRWLTTDDYREWSKYYLGLASAAGALLVAELALLPSLLPEGSEHATVAVLFVLLTAVVTCDHYR